MDQVRTFVSWFVELRSNSRVGKLGIGNKHFDLGVECTLDKRPCVLETARSSFWTIKVSCSRICWSSVMADSREAKMEGSMRGLESDIMNALREWWVIFYFDLKRCRTGISDSKAMRRRVGKVEKRIRRGP